MAPEILEKKSYNRPADMWSVGAIAYFLCEGKSDMNLNALALKGNIPSIDKKFSNEMQKFINNLLSLDPNKRMTAKEALDSNLFCKVISKDLEDFSEQQC